MTVVELRRYALHPGARERLIELFERELIEPQEAVGMQVLGQFRDLDAPDAFVWLRGFADMHARRRALGAFYGGPVWERHKDAANATMVDSDDVLLLRPAGDGGLAGGGDRPGGLVTVITCPGAGALSEPIVGAVPELVAAGADVRAVLRSHPGPNDFPRLPVREGEDVAVVIAAFADEAAHARWAGSPAWRGLGARLPAAPRVARLRPTARSLLQA